MSQQEERLVTTILNGDTDVLESLDEADAQPLAAAVSASFIALIRSRISVGDDEAIAGLASAATLVDSDGRPIPRWIVEAAARSALGDLHMLEGVPPQKLIDTHAAFVRDTTPTMPPAEREQVAGVAAEIVRDASDHKER